MLLIDYENVNIYHSSGEPVLQGVNFQVSEGELVYLIGRVGSGKSSLLKSIYCELEVKQADRAIVLGQNLKTIRQKQIPDLRKQMGIIFQDFQLLTDRTVQRNLDFVLKATGWKDKGDISRRIDEVLGLVGMQDKKERRPHELSGGEQQRVAIARAILNSPKLIVADEPTGNLDPQTADSIISLLHDIAQSGTAVVVSTHNRNLLSKYRGRVFQFADSRIEDVSADYLTETK